MKRRLIERIRAAWRAFRDDEPDGIDVRLELWDGRPVLTPPAGAEFTESDMLEIKEWVEAVRLQRAWPSTTWH